MARVYSKIERDSGGIDVIERNRPAVVRQSVHESRDAEADRGEVRLDVQPKKWIDATSLDAPEPRVGFVQKWIADGSVNNEQRDASHWMKKRREGWSPRDPSTVPASERLLYPTEKSSHGEDIIRVAGLVLCEMPRQVAMQRLHAVRDRSNHQYASVPESLQELRSRERMPGVGPIEVTDGENSLRGRRSATMVD
jgi:hypothetical protein